jgi:hypothetical protein
MKEGRLAFLQKHAADPIVASAVLTAPDLSSLLRLVETDLSLVHAAYYTDDECIERIADWIAGKAQTIEVEGVPSDTVRLAS